MVVCSPVLGDLIWQQRGWDGKMFSIVKLISFAVRYYSIISLNQHAMRTLKEWILASKEGRWTLLPEDFPASPILSLEKGKEQMISATCGQQCLERFRKSGQPGLWQKMFADLLVGTGVWFSSRCALIWKLRDTRYNRFLFQLQVSAHRTEGKGSELSLTPSVTMISGRSAVSLEKRKQWRASQGRKTVPPGNLAEQIMMILEGKSAVDIILPTPASRDYKGARSLEALIKAGRSLSNSLPDIFAQTGKSSQLSSLSIQEMMGYPSRWLESPFQNGERKA